MFIDNILALLLSSGFFNCSFFGEDARIGSPKNEVFGGVCTLDGVDDIVSLLKDKLKSSKRLVWKLGRPH